MKIGISTNGEKQTRREIPRQMNGSDCGMFMLNYARNIASFTDEDLKNNAFTFHQRDMVNLRGGLVLEILKIGGEGRRGSSRKGKEKKKKKKKPRDDKNAERRGREHREHSVVNHTRTS